MEIGDVLLGRDHFSFLPGLTQAPLFSSHAGLSLPTRHLPPPPSPCLYQPLGPPSSTRRSHTVGFPLSPSSPWRRGPDPPFLPLFWHKEAAEHSSTSPPLSTQEAPRSSPHRRLRPPCRLSTLSPEFVAGSNGFGAIAVTTAPLQ
jgi:hypothetical protein